MGDLNSSDCSRKKIVIAKANKWSSLIKSAPSETDNTIRTIDTILQHDTPNEIPLKSVKIEEDDESCVKIDYNTATSNEVTSESDPLLLSTVKQRRRRSLEASQIRETPEARASRLAKMSTYAAQRLANESPEQRSNRLRRMSAYAAKRLANETNEQRAKRLSRMSAYAAMRLANETPEQRRARLARMSAYAARRQAMKKSISPGFPNDELYKRVP